MSDNIRYSKPSKDLNIKYSDFVFNNDSALKSVLEINNKYSDMKLREFCKICTDPIRTENYIISFGIPYFLCNLCGHLNGRFQDIGEFSKFLYSENSGTNYSENYEKNFEERVNSIYRPKAEFLFETLQNQGGLDLTRTLILDVGAGAGHFLKALELIGISGEGIEVNETLVKQSNQYLSRNSNNVVNANLVLDYVKNSKADVISLIGTLEHLEDPISAIDAFCHSKAKYLYISVPMISLTAIVQGLDETVYPRQLSAGHTHLFSNSSLEYLINKFTLLRVGEWWFGTDFLDLMRTLSVKRTSQDVFANNSKILEIFLAPVLDELQMVLDRNKLCSELHLILSKETS